MALTALMITEKKVTSLWNVLLETLMHPLVSGSDNEDALKVFAAA
jgi:hypothetical protein